MSTDPVRVEIMAAMQRLLEGHPLRSSGDLTVVQLAAEAGVKRWRLTHQNVDLMREFQAKVRRANGVSEIESRLQEQIAGLEADLLAAQMENAELRDNLATYAQVIDDLNTAFTAATSQPQSIRSIRR